MLPRRGGFSACSRRRCQPLLSLFPSLAPAVRVADQCGVVVPFFRVSGHAPTPRLLYLVHAFAAPHLQVLLVSFSTRLLPFPPTSLQQTAVLRAARRRSPCWSNLTPTGGAHSTFRCRTMPRGEQDLNAQRTSIEIAAEQVTEAKHYLVELDRRKNQYREAQRKILAARPEEEPWILSGGSTFVSCELSHSDTLKFFEWRLQQCDNEIEAARDDLTLRVAALAELEGADSALARLYEGFDLKGMS